MNSEMRMELMKKQIETYKNECVNIPSVPKSFMKNREKIINK